MTRALFTYPNYGTPDGFPEYTARSGQVVEVGEARDGESEECETIYLIRFADGFNGEAFESELEPYA